MLLLSTSLIEVRCSYDPCLLLGWMTPIDRSWTRGDRYHFMLHDHLVVVLEAEHCWTGFVTGIWPDVVYERTVRLALKSNDPIETLKRLRGFIAYPDADQPVQNRLDSSGQAE